MFCLPLPVPFAQKNLLAFGANRDQRALGMRAGRWTSLASKHEMISQQKQRQQRQHNQRQQVAASWQARALTCLHCRRWPTKDARAVGFSRDIWGSARAALVGLALARAGQHERPK